MPSTGRTIYIAGAGIAGLTLALALAKFGANVVVLERNPSLQEYGAGLQISPNARRILDQLGLDKAITATSFEPEGIDIYPFGARQPLTTLELGAAMRERYGVPYAVMHRADLAEALYKACRRFGNIDILFGVKNFNALSHKRGVTVLAEEADKRQRNARGFAFVGADGVNSLTRTKILGGPIASFGNRVAWRTLVDIDAMRGLLALDRTTLLLGPGYHGVCYPLPHRGQFNIALFALSHDVNSFETAPARPLLPKGFGRSQHFDAILATAGDSWGYWPLASLDVESWHQDNIGLIGDAAHAMEPFQAQGAAMAIEDAAILAPLLMTEPNAESAFSRFTALRRARVSEVQQLSHRNGQAFHMKWPLSLARNAVIKSQGPRGHFRRLDWLYSYAATPEVAISTTRKTPR